MLITRSVADNASLAQQLSALGADIVEVPLTEVLAPVDGGVALRRAVTELSSYRWVVLTSVNGVQALRNAIAEVVAANPNADRPEPMAVAPVGPATERAARDAGFTVINPPTVATAESLVASFPAPDGQRSDRVLAPLAELAGDTVVDGLSAMGYSVDRVTAYRTAAPAGSIEPGVEGADVVTFFSPSAVDRFVERFGRSGVPGIVVCVGPSTSARAVEHRLAGVVTASPHSAAGVVAAVQTAAKALSDRTDRTGRTDR